jgi:hypothetical protein
MLIGSMWLLLWLLPVLLSAQTYDIVLQGGRVLDPESGLMDPALALRTAIRPITMGIGNLFLVLLDGPSEGV